jgi:hypothetical protein
MLVIIQFQDLTVALNFQNIQMHKTAVFTIYLVLQQFRCKKHKNHYSTM